jgi:predicted PurR-regulated permease PerM
MTTSKNKLDFNKYKLPLIISVIIAILFTLWFLSDYFVIIALAAILAFLFNPFYKWMLKKTNGKAGLSAGTTFVLVVFSVAIPISVLIVITVEQALQVVDVIEKAAKGSGGLFNTVQNLITNANQQLDKLPSLGPETIKIGQITDWLKENASKITQSAINILTGVAGGLSSLITKSILFIFVFLSLLKNQAKIFDIVHTLNPLGDESTKRYLARMGAMTTAMVKGQFMIAIAQGFVDAALLKIVGIDFFIFWFVLITFLSIIPLGGGIIVIPLGIVLVLTGNIWQGLLLIFGHILIVTNIDNVLRPKFVPKTARLDSALLMMSVFAGIGLFGFLGIVIGPVLMIIAVTTIDNYLDFVKYTKKQQKAPSK